MHQLSHDEMARNIEKFLGNERARKLSVIDVGSQDINGSYRDLILDPWSYLGIDVVAGRNVDCVMSNEFTIPLKDSTADMVLCGQVLEHCRNPFRLVREIARILRENGYLFVTSPAVWQKHEHPIDCFRFYADGMRAVLEDASLNVITCYEIPSPCGMDTWAIARKGRS